MTPVIWSDEAILDLDRIYAFLEPRGEAFAIRVRRRLQTRAASLAKVARQGRSLEGSVRALSVPDIQYVLSYRLLPTFVLITSVRHTREDAR